MIHSQPNNLYLIHLAVEFIDTLPQQMDIKRCDLLELKLHSSQPYMLKSAITVVLSRVHQNLRSGLGGIQVFIHGECPTRQLAEAQQATFATLFMRVFAVASWSV